MADKNCSSIIDSLLKGTLDIVDGKLVASTPVPKKRTRKTIKED